MNLFIYVTLAGAGCFNKMNKFTYGGLESPPRQRYDAPVIPSDRSFTGPPVDDPQLLAAHPADLRTLLGEANGFISMLGGLHVRGICPDPLWHSLAHVWTGEMALHRLFRDVRSDDVPFAQDCLGDQFLLRDGRVVRLAGETGEIEDLRMNLADFLGRADRDPLDSLSLQPLMDFREEHGELQPGALIHVAPPFCLKDIKGERSLSPVPAFDLLNAHATLAKEIQDLPDGTWVEVVPGE